MRFQAELDAARAACDPRTHPPESQPFTGIIRGFVHDTSDQIVIAIASEEQSMSLIDLLEDTVGQCYRTTDLVDLCPGMDVDARISACLEEGISAALPALELILCPMMRRRGQRTPIVCVGHSLGGAYAQVLACVLGYRWTRNLTAATSAFAAVILCADVRAVSFGAPKCGNGIFMADTMTANNVCVENTWDVIPRLPCTAYHTRSSTILNTVFLHPTPSSPPSSSSGYDDAPFLPEFGNIMGYLEGRGRPREWSSPTAEDDSDEEEESSGSSGSIGSSRSEHEILFEHSLQRYAELLQ